MWNRCLYPAFLYISDNLTASYAQCMTTAYKYTVTYNESCLAPELSSDSRAHHGRFTACNSIAIRWIWCLTLIIMTPELFVFLRCLWSICFKVEARPKARSLFTVSLLRYSRIQCKTNNSNTSFVNIVVC